jgi:uncharacterized protein
VRVNRFDVAEIGKPVRTPQGFLRVAAFLTRAGVFEYKRHDGSTARELRPPEEVFRADSLASLSAAPLTDLHPTEMVSPKNVRTLRVGHVGEAVRQDGNRVAATVTIEDEQVIALVERGDRREISCGYACEVDATPGTWNGERYDAVQRDIVYNHAALGPRNWGRAGSEVALRLDSGDAMTASAFSAPPERRDDGPSDPPGEESEMEPVTIRVDGLDVQAPKQSAQVIEKALKERDDALAERTKERDTALGRADAAEKEVKDLKAKLTAVEDPKRLDQAVSARSALLEQARKVLPAEHKFDGQTPRQIHEAVLKKLDDKLDLTGKSDEYVQARFDGAIASAPAQQSTGRNDALERSRAATSSSAPQSTPAARQDAFVPEWQKPLAMSKDARS